VRSLDPHEVAKLMYGDLVAKVGWLGLDGHPQVTPLWFHWDGETVRLTSSATRPHVAPLRADGRVTVCIDDEDPEGPDGQRPNRQVRLMGVCTVSEDSDGAWTQIVREKYLRSADSGARAGRVVIAMRPRQIIAISSV
jgi:hypothetical protein